MAHAGKFYPVIFRRDWNLNVISNQTGWANRYIVRLFTHTGGFGSAAYPFVYQCGPGVESPFGTMRWSSQVVHTLIFDFQVTLAADFGPTGAFYNKTGKLSELSVGTITSWRQGAEKPIDPGWPTPEGGTTIFWDPLWFDADPALWLSSIAPKRWADGPPH
jgi:hypothetical protein